MRFAQMTVLAWVCLGATAGSAPAQGPPGRLPPFALPAGPLVPPFRHAAESVADKLRQGAGQTTDTVRQAGAEVAQGLGRVTHAVGGDLRVGWEGIDYRNPIFGRASVSRFGEVRVNAGVPGVARIAYDHGTLYAIVDAHSARASAAYVPGRYLGVDTPLYGGSLSNSGGVIGGSAKYNGVRVSGDTAGNVSAGYSVGPGGVGVGRGADGSLGANGYAQVGGNRVLAAVSNTRGAYVTASGAFGQIRLTPDGRLSLNGNPGVRILLRPR